MRTLRALAALSAAVLTTLLLAGSASAQGATVSVGRVTVGQGGQGNVVLGAAGVAAPGLGAWEINVNYDPSVVSIVSCTPNGGLCNTGVSDHEVRVVGATAAGLTNSFSLATLRFQCLHTGASDLTLKIDVFSDATHGAPVPIATKIEDGSVTCNAAQQGDVNCDGRTDAIDAALVLQYTAGLIDTLPCIEVGDMNGDGRIDSIDAFLILVSQL